MKKLVILILAVLLSLSGCAAKQSKAELVEELQDIIDNALNMDSLTGDIDLTMNVDIDATSSVTTTIAAKLIVAGYGSDELEAYLDYALTSSSETIDMDMYMTGDMIYIDLNGDKYYQQLDTGSEDELTSVSDELTTLDAENVESISKSKQGDTTVYEVVITAETVQNVISDLLSDLGAGSFDDDSLAINATDFVISVDGAGHISNIAIDLAADINISDDYTLAASISGNVAFSDIDASTVVLPDDLDTYQEYVDYSTALLAWLTSDDSGYAEVDDGVYMQVYADGQYYYFDLNSNLYTFQYGSDYYDYYYTQDLGNIDSCMYYIADGTATNCTDDDKEILEYTKQALEYDLSLAGITLDMLY